MITNFLKKLKIGRKPTSDDPQLTQSPTSQTDSVSQVDSTDQTNQASLARLSSQPGQASPTGQANQTGVASGLPPHLSSINHIDTTIIEPVLADEPVSELRDTSLSGYQPPTLSAPAMQTPTTPVPSPESPESPSAPTQLPPTLLVPQAPPQPTLSQPSRPVIRSGQPFSNNYPKKIYEGPKPTVLLILDGWGIGPENAGNAIALANTPNIDGYWATYPHTQLAASGQAVGLPQGEDGNTETGHLNIGAGHIVYQDLPRINMSIADGSFNTNPAFVNAINHVKKHNSTLHLMGLIGSGGVHSNIEHLYALLNLCKLQGLTQVYIHGFTDGRDSPPTSGINYVQQTMDHCESLGIGKIASLMGRYYAMDRDKKWDRIEKAYNALTVGSSDQCVIDPIGAIQAQYDQGTTDEFIEPIVVCDEDGTKRLFQDNDAAIFFNYRIDRPRELSRAFVMPDFESGIDDMGFDPYTEKYEKTNIQPQKIIQTFKRQKVINNLYFTTMTRYEENLPTDVAFPPQNIKMPIGKVFAQHGLRQLRITETEKERFVTYYMNGQEEIIFPGEERIIVPSKGVKSYDQAPEMSAKEIADEMIAMIKQDKCDVVIANICNADMVAHTGNLEATIQACEVVDREVKRIVDEVLLRRGQVFITADHGNAEELINNETGEVDTEHSIYPVPLIVINDDFRGNGTMLPSGILADVAPTILHLMGLEKPDPMTGQALGRTLRSAF